MLLREVYREDRLFLVLHPLFFFKGPLFEYGFIFGLPWGFCGGVAIATDLTIQSLQNENERTTCLSMIVGWVGVKRSTTNEYNFWTREKKGQ